MNQFYIQTLGGVNARFTIPSIDSLIDQNIMVNKAEIILPFEDYLYDEYSSPPTSLFIYRKNNNGEIMSFYLIYLKEVKEVVTIL